LNDGVMQTGGFWICEILFGCILFSVTFLKQDFDFDFKHFFLV